MNKTAIKNFAIWARNKLIADVSYDARLIGITENGIAKPLPQSFGGTQFFDIGTAEPYSISGEAVRQRDKLIEVIQQKEKDTDYKTAYQYVIEEVAYTWFNRLIAIRFMEVNDYLPSHIRVLSSESGKLEPDLVTTPFDAELPFTAEEEAQIFQLKQDNKLDEAFRILFLKQCNALNEILPALFEKTKNYTELLLSLSVIDQDGVVYHLIHDIPEDDFNIERGGQVEIIGWLYQYYNTEPKAAAFAKNGKITKEEIPAVTQLFTPDWIVRYMVENSLGRLWVEGHPDCVLKENWKYYLEEAQQEPEVQAKLSEIRKEYAALNPEDIKLIDPCMGSGHILVYAFDVLMQIYESAGYSQRDAAKSILEHNIYGLDIDDRAYQLAYFAVMMKARQYNRRILNGENSCHVYAIQESNSINRAHLKYFGAGLDDIEKNAAKMQLEGLLDTLTDAKEYGSILTITPQDWDALYARFDEVADESSFHRESIRKKLLPLVRVAQTLAQKYDVVVTNPPYMSELNKTLQDFVKEFYPNSKHDLCSVFIERCLEMVHDKAYVAMITQNAFMFLSRYEKLRRYLLQYQFVNLAHLGARAFDAIGGEVVQTVTFCIRRTPAFQYVGTYERLVDFQSEEEKNFAFLKCKNTYYCKSDVFDVIPKAPMTYWVSENVLKMFEYGRLDDYADPRVGMFTTDNDRYLREWWEPNRIDIGFDYKEKSIAYKSDIKWFPYNKGGGFRRWYGNIDLVVFWQHGGEKIKKVVLKKYPYLKGNYDFVLKTDNPYYHPGITWSGLTSGLNSFRLCGNGFLFDTNKGAMIFEKNLDLEYLLGFLNTKVAQTAIDLLNSTISLQIGDVASIPVIVNTDKFDTVKLLAKKCVSMCKDDWDSFETSWDFTRHPFIKAITKYPNMMDIGNIYLAECYDIWAGECEERFEKLKANEEELNRIFIDIYGLQDELTPEVEDKDVTVRRADLSRDVRSFISYAVGCMFGRYSPTYDGLAYAGGTWDDGKYNIYKPDADGIIPICDDEYFEDDMVGRFVEFVRVVYGDSSLEDNLRFIANALGGKGQPKEVIRNYFLNDFYADHCKIYQKRPIYWLFDSGKKNGFKCLIYLHRYQPDTIARIRTDYVHEQQARYRTAIEGLEKQAAAATSTSERVKLTKQLNKVQAQDTELHQYEEKVHALADQMIKIDLDDGVKHNYEIFKDVLAKIK